MSTTTIAYEVNIDNPTNLTAEALALLWHASQDNPAPLDAPSTHTFAECIDHEIIRRWLAIAPVPSAENVCVTAQDHSSNELKRATDALKSSLENISAAGSNAKDFFVYLKARAQVELLTTLSELNAKNPSFESAYKSVSEARDVIGSLHNMGETMDFIFGANEEGAGL